MQRTLFGNSIERLVCAFLEDHELTCVKTNFYCRLGEIDLVMHEASSNTLVFVEVRFRASASHGGATLSVDWKKQRKLRRTVLFYLQKHADAKQAARIDVIGVSSIHEPCTDAAALMTNVSIHHYRTHQLIWTRNAVEDV